MFKRGRCVWFFAGNISHERALTTVETVRNNLALQPMELEDTVEVRVVSLPAGQALVRDSPLTDPNNNNSCLVTVFEIGPEGDDIHLGLQAAVMMQWMFQPFFDDLRTKQQLGYVVHLRRI